MLAFIESIAKYIIYILVILIMLYIYLSLSLLSRFISGIYCKTRKVASEAYIHTYLLKLFMKNDSKPFFPSPAGCHIFEAIL